LFRASSSSACSRSSVPHEYFSPSLWSSPRPALAVSVYASTLFLQQPPAWSLLMIVAVNHAETAGSHGRLSISTFCPCICACQFRSSLVFHLFPALKFSNQASSSFTWNSEWKQEPSM
jgi:hypothetical protein